MFKVETARERTPSIKNFIICNLPQEYNELFRIQEKVTALCLHLTNKNAKWTATKW